MRTSRAGLAELVELGGERRFRRRELLRKGLVTSGAVAVSGLGVTLLSLGDEAFADNTTDIQILQTAASVENLAVGTYQTALTLPFIGGSGANPVVKSFVITTMGQHGEHAKAFN